MTARLAHRRFLARLLYAPRGRQLRPNPNTEAMVREGCVTVDSTGAFHLTRAGWEVVGSHWQELTWLEAVDEHCRRQGPADARTVRRLVLSYDLTLRAARRLTLSHPAVAADLYAEATLILMRLAVLSGVPLSRAEETRVGRAASDLHAELTARPVPEPRLTTEQAAAVLVATAR